MSSQKLFNPRLMAAEMHEKAAEQSREKGDKAKAVEHWEQAANRYIEEKVFDKAIACLDNAGRLREYVIELLGVFDPDKVLAVFQKKGYQEELALAFLHLQSRGEEAMQVGAYENCCALAEKALKRSADQALPYLQGAMLAASWAGDDDKLIKAADLATGGNITSKGQEDRIRFLMVKIAVSGDFQLMPELSKTASSVESARVPYNPFQIRLLAPIYLYRGIKLTALLGTMRSNRALLRYAKLYDALFAGIEAGEADKALENFFFAIEGQSDHPDPSSPLTAWEDVDRCFPNIYYAQPECLAATIVWDQVWATRAAAQELRETIAQAKSHLKTEKQADVERLVDKITGSPLFGYLPKTLQADVYQLACTAAFRAEKWDEFDRLAVTLEESYGVKNIVRAVAASSV